MGNTADLAMVQKTIIDTLRKEGKSQRVLEANESIPPMPVPPIPMPCPQCIPPFSPIFFLLYWGGYCIMKLGTI